MNYEFLPEADEEFREATAETAPLGLRTGNWGRVLLFVTIWVTVSLL